MNSIANPFSDRETRFQFLAALIWDRPFLEAKSAVVHWDDFKSVDSKQHYSWSLAYLALTFWKKHREPAGSLIVNEIQKWFSASNASEERKEEFWRFLKIIRKHYDPGRSEVLQEAVADWKRQKAYERTILEMRTVLQSNQMTEEKWQELAGKVYFSDTGNESTEDWPEPLPIATGLPPVEPFSIELLPASFRALVRDVTERMQVPLDYPAVAAVVCLAGAVNRRATIRPKELDDSWEVVPNLWGGIIAPPGFMKSPVLHSVTRPLNQIQSAWMEEYENALRNYTQAKEQFQLRLAAWKEQFKASTKKGKMTPKKPTDQQEEPVLRRLIVNDATFEDMHQTMSENPSGIFVIRDELTGWLAELDRAGREGERAFCLQAWNGDTGHTIDRIGRGTIHVEHCCMSLLGGIQPARLGSYLVDALQDGPSNDGLMQRFQVLVWPDTSPEWKLVDRPLKQAAADRAACVFDTLVTMQPNEREPFKFTEKAQAVFNDFLTRLEAKVRGDQLHPALICHLSKYRSLMPSLALLFELADQAAGRERDGSLVTVEHTKQAAAWCYYLESHARRVYSCVTTPQMRAAQELAAKMKQRKLWPEGIGDAQAVTFSPREVYLHHWSGLDTPEAVKRAVEVLEDAGWIREAGAERERRIGRPSEKYAVNPKVWSE